MLLLIGVHETVYVSGRRDVFSAQLTVICHAQEHFSTIGLMAGRIDCLSSVE
jgi:hypothetical protein